MSKLSCMQVIVLVFFSILLNFDLIGLFIDNYYLFHSIIFVVLVLIIRILYNGSVQDRRESVLFYFAIGYCVFHFGVVPVYLVSPDEIDIIGFNIFQWYGRLELMVPAYSLALIYLIGTVASLLLPKEWIVPVQTTSKLKDRSLMLASAALFVMTFSIVVWCYLVYTTGFGSYDILLEGLNEGGRGALIGILHAGIGISFVLAVSMSKKLRLPLIIFGLWALIAFPLGLRGEVAFPVLLAMALMSSQGRLQLKPWKIALLAVSFLAISSAVAVFRNGLGQNTFLNSVSVVRGIAELGGSIRPAYEVVDWLNSGDTLLLGGSYFAPFERTFLRIFPIVDRIPAELDNRLMNVLIDNRAGAYGFSIAAEAFYNFGNFGSFVIGLMSGWVARAAGRIAERRLFQPVSMALVFGLFIHIRQSFVTGYGFFLASLLFLTLIWFISRGMRQWNR